jgi:hypothetical protein
MLGVYKSVCVYVVCIKRSHADVVDKTDITDAYTSHF